MAVGNCSAFRLLVMQYPCRVKKLSINSHKKIQARGQPSLDVGPQGALGPGVLFEDLVAIS